MLTKDTLAESKVGHFDEASKCFDHDDDAIFQAQIRLVDLGTLLMQLQASCGITTCLIPPSLHLESSKRSIFQNTNAAEDEFIFFLF